MSDNRTQKAKDQEWLRDVVRRALFVHDDCGEHMEGIFCYANHGVSRMLVDATPSFQIGVALALIKSFQNETGISTSTITGIIEHSLNEA